MSKWICVDDICIPSDENDWEELVAFADAIAEQEPIDIVRCRECKYGEYREEFDDYECHASGCGLVHDVDFYCADGERSSDEID